jgi:Sec-independent protein secretion pathway component TatC
VRSNFIYGIVLTIRTEVIPVSIVASGRYWLILGLAIVIAIVTTRLWRSASVHVSVAIAVVVFSSLSTSVCQWILEAQNVLGKAQDERLKAGKASVQGLVL